MERLTELWELTSGKFMGQARRLVVQVRVDVLSLKAVDKFGFKNQFLKCMPAYFLMCIFHERPVLLHDTQMLKSHLLYVRQLIV